MKNGLIVPLFQFLQKVSLKNKASRGRNKFLKRLQEKSKEFDEALNDIKKEYFEVNDNGELVADEDGTLTFLEGADKDELNEKVKELEEETFEIHFGEHSSKFNAMFDALDDLDQELSGQEAHVYNELMDAYENNEEEE